jgi:hypothetical protein
MLALDRILFTAALQNTIKMIKIKADEMCGPCRWHVRNKECRQIFGCKTSKETTDEMMSKCIRQTGWGSVHWVHLAQDMDQGS